MIVIDKSLSVQKIFLTLDGLFFAPTLIIQNNSTNKFTNIPLGLDLSSFSFRYNKFEVSTDLFENLEQGFYSYKVNAIDGKEIEVGKLYILPTPPAALPLAPQPNNDFKVFNK